MTEHTPGSWERRVNNAGHVQIVRKRLPHETEFEPVALLTSGPVGPNARLIAAAPDLLAALEAMVGFFEDNHLDGHLGPIEDCPFLADYNQACAALERAKARK